MEDNQFRFWDIFIKGIGFLATAASIYIGLTQFKRQEMSTSQLEFNRNYWQAQNRVYSELCRNAGAMAANLGNPKEFDKEKTNFLALYYGEVVLVEDGNVDSAMRELRYYLDVFNPGDAGMQQELKQKVFRLADLCRQSSLVFKKAHLKEAGQ